jgi:putative transposase
MYARGMSVREIVGHLRELYGVDVSPDLISAVTDAVLDEIAAWQGRPLEPVYPLIFFDALRIKVRDEGVVRNKAVHIALGVRADGAKEVLGLWLEQNEGAKHALGLDPRVLAARHERAEKPRRRGRSARRRRWIKGLSRRHPRGVSRGDGADLHRPSLAPQPRLRLLQRPQGRRRGADGVRGGLWGRRYPAIAQSWRRAWCEVIPFCGFPADVRRILYTTNAIEALNAKLRRAVRARGHFPTDEAAMKLLFLVLNRAEKEWKMPPREWVMAKAQFAVIFGERFAKAMQA